MQLKTKGWFLHELEVFTKIILIYNTNQIEHAPKVQKVETKIWDF